MRVSWVIFFLLTVMGCTSTHSLLIYKINCDKNYDPLRSQIIERDFEFSKAEDYQVCSGFQRYQITRKNITQTHLDGRSFKMEEIRRLFYAKVNTDRCEVTIVTPLNGRVSDLNDTNYLLNQYYYGPLISRISKSSKKDVLYSSQISFGSEDEFKKYCNSND